MIYLVGGYASKIAVSVDGCGWVHCLVTLIRLEFLI